MTARVRPRQSWEAIDLGFMLVQKWWGKIALSWLVLTLPIFILINILLVDHHILAIIAFWWLMPIFDRIPLHIISRALFGEVESNRANIKAIPKIIFPHFIKMLTYLRFDPSRSFNLPVWQLEKLTGRARADRSRVLNKVSSGSAFGLMFMCILIELIILLSLFAIVYMFTPEVYTDAMLAVFNFDGIDRVWWSGMSVNVLFYIAFLIVQPFYVAGGFSLYINRRTQLEGWDIEILFRQLAQRTRKSSKYVAGLVCAASILLGGMFYPADTSYADETVGLETINKTNLDNAGARTAIDEIMEQKEFNKMIMVKKWRYVGENEEGEWSFFKWVEDTWKGLFDDLEDKEEDEEDWSFSKWLSDIWKRLFGDSDASSSDSSSSEAIGLITSFGEVILWIFASFIVTFAIYYAYVFWTRQNFSKNENKNKRKLPKSLFGLEITPESLPDDVGMAAMELWRNQDPLAALSLLYRGALTTLVHHYGINLKGSATEGDCIRIADINKEKLVQGSMEYFKHLTQAWQQAAYAHRLPDEQEIIKLGEQWAPTFGVPS